MLVRLLVCYIVQLCLHKVSLTSALRKGRPVLEIVQDRFCSGGRDRSRSLVSASIQQASLDNRHTDTDASPLEAAAVIFSGDSPDPRAKRVA